MSIEIHCEHCGKVIRAPDDSGGKKGKCPHCKQTLYIPAPVDEIDVIPLAPIDKEDERRAQELKEESSKYTASLSKAQGSKYDVDPVEKGGGDGVAPPPVPGETVDIPDSVEEYVLAMGESKLDEAERIVTRLSKVKVRARDYIEGLLLDQMPPQIGNLPEPVMKGFLNTLSGRLS